MNSRQLKDSNAYHRKQYAKNREKYKGYSIKHKFGITLDDFNNLCKKQRSLCAICKLPLEINKEQNNSKTRPCIDHCHITNKVRGILCAQCNRGLGHFNDDIDMLKKAIKYLRKFQ